MLPLDKRMVLNIERATPTVPVSPTSFVTLSGFIAYTAAVADPMHAGKSTLTSFNRPAHLGTPNMSVLKTDMPTSASLFVIEAKLHDISDHIPQAISEIYACGRHLEQADPTSLNAHTNVLYQKRGCSWCSDERS